MDQVARRRSIRFAEMFLGKVIQTFAVVTKHHFCCEVVSFHSGNASSQENGDLVASCRAQKALLWHRVAIISRMGIFV